MDFVGNLLLFTAVKEFWKSIKTDKVIAMDRVAPFFLTVCQFYTIFMAALCNRAGH